MRGILFYILVFTKLAIGCPYESMLETAVALRGPGRFDSNNVGGETPHRPERIPSLFDERHLQAMEGLCKHEGLDLYPGKEYLDRANSPLAIELFKRNWDSILQRAQREPELANRLDRILASYLKHPPLQGTHDEYRYLPGLDERTTLPQGLGLDELFANAPARDNLLKIQKNIEQSTEGSAEVLMLDRYNNPERQALLIARARTSYIMASLIKRRLYRPQFPPITLTVP